MRYGTVRETEWVWDKLINGKGEDKRKERTED
jgi:hypothetical protein